MATTAKIVREDKKLKYSCRHHNRCHICGRPHGVYGMLPKNKLRDQRITRLKVFVGAEHSYADKLNK